jgi:hypothetical protein
MGTRSLQQGLIATSKGCFACMLALHAVGCCL